MRTIPTALVAALALSTLVACTPREERFESVVQVVSRVDVEKNDKGEVEQVDFEFEWDPCPGDQFQVVRGGKELAKCMEKYGKGDYVSATVKHFWDPHGYYRWDIEKLGDCSREIESTSEGSFERSQECGEHRMYGRPSGFECSRRPFRKLLGACPFMARE